MEYLHAKQHYIDLYDLLTIKECIDVVKFWQKAYKEHVNDAKIKDLPEDEKIKGFSIYLNWQLYFTKGERFRNKEKNIDEMLKRDRERQEFYDNTPEPKNISCDVCGINLLPNGKILQEYDRPMKLLFYFRCAPCKTTKAIYHTGEEHIFKPKLCSKCGKGVKETHKTQKKGSIIVWKYSCPSCKHTEEHIDNFKKDHLSWENEKKIDKMLLEKNREEYCLSDIKGKEYIEYDFIEKAKYAHKVAEEEEHKFDDSAYEQAMSLDKFGIVELEKKLSEALEKENFSRLSFDKPEIDRFVIVPFTVLNFLHDRSERLSIYDIKRLINETLKNTNWRLMSEGISYRLGYHSGRLKGYERVDDLLELSGKKNVEKRLTVDDNKKMKYEADNYVQLTRLMGQYKGEENMRKRRLKKEPEGFFLTDTGSNYNCAICYRSTPGNKIWWTPDAIYCADCWKNIKSGIIPPLSWDHKNKIWIKEWQMQDDYGVHPSTRRKLRREGLLRGRELKDEKGFVYYTVYLVEENQKFLRKYPKKPEMKVLMK